LALQLGARVIAVGGPQSPVSDVPGDALLGRIITRVPAAEVATVGSRAGVLAVLPEDRVLAVPSVADIALALDARWLHETDEPAAFDRIMIGTVASDAGSPYFANRERTCVITRFDKTDIQLAALLTDLRCMVITGGGVPSPYLIDRVSGRREEVALLATDRSTVETMETIEPLYGQSRFAGEGKLARVVAMLDAAAVKLPVAVAS
jgi:BioD-like phosphotransacetylase family protein